MAVKESKNFMNYIEKFTKVDYMKLYQRLFTDRRLFFKMAKGMKLPSNIEYILGSTEKNTFTKYNKL